MADGYEHDPVQTRDISAPHGFQLSPGAEARAALAEELGISNLRKLTFKGRISPDGADDLVLEAALGATVVQPCVVTFAPVTTRIDEPVVRHYLKDMPDLPEGDEVEMPEDEKAEPLPREINLAEIMAEALALAIPPWPRAEGVDPVEMSVTEPGKDAMTDDDVKPFAALKSLRDKLADKDDDEA